MNHHFNFYRGAIVINLASVLAVLVVAPAVNAAAVVRGATSNVVASSVFCSTLATKQTTFTGNLNGLVAKVGVAWTTRNQKLTEEANAVDQKVIVDRASADSKRVAAYAKLEAKATTSTQKAAVMTYEQTVTSAVSTRRTSYDAARATYRQAVTTAVTNRQTIVSTQETTFTSSVNTAFALAVTNCAAGNDTVTNIRQTLVSSLQSSRQTFQTDRTGDTKVMSQLTQFSTARDQAFSTADQAFTTSTKTAATALKDAFGSSSTSVS